MSMKLKERLTSLPLFVLFALAFYYSRRFPKVPKMLPTALRARTLTLPSRRSLASRAGPLSVGPTK